MNDVTDPSGQPGTPPLPQVAGAPPDFTRLVVPILGLPFDAMTLAQATEAIRAAAASGKRCFLSTPNLNFTIAARSDRDFRDSVLHSDLSLVDGMPLVWIARLLGLPITERVSGADVFDALQTHPGAALSVYLFGAPSGAASRASERINARGGGLRCVGFDEGGFGSIESLSSDAHIDRINASGARFVVVSLGARKGQAWIERNAARLRAPVLAHLGAVVNFVAGSVARAPRWMQVGGLEWAWRIKEEPGLWRRYASDARSAGWLLATRVVPDAIGAARRRRRFEPAVVDVESAPDSTTLVLRGSWGGTQVADLRSALTRAAQGHGRLVIDLRAVTAAGAPLIGLLLLADGWFRGDRAMTLVGASGSVTRDFHRQMAESLL